MNFFAKFKKYKLMKDQAKTQKELELEFDIQLKKIVELSNSPSWEFIKEYFEARIELNRDQIELLLNDKKADFTHIQSLTLLNNELRDFVKGIAAKLATIKFKNGGRG